MPLLLDTHAFLWFIDNDPRLSATAAARIADPATDVYVSVVSAWEIVIKLGTGKLTLDRPLAQLCRRVWTTIISRCSTLPPSMCWHSRVCHLTTAIRSIGS